MPGTLVRRAVLLFVLVAGVLLHVAVLHPSTATASTGVIAAQSEGIVTEADGAERFADCPSPHAPSHAPSAADAPLKMPVSPGLLPMVGALPEHAPGPPPVCAIPDPPTPSSSAGADLCTELCVSRR